MKLIESLREKAGKARSDWPGVVPTVEIPVPVLDALCDAAEALRQAQKLRTECLDTDQAHERFEYTMDVVDAALAKFDAMERPTSTLREGEG